MKKQTNKLNIFRRNKNKIRSDGHFKMIFVLLIVSIFSVGCAKVSDELGTGTDNKIGNIDNGSTNTGSTTGTDTVKTAAQDMSVFKTTLYPVLTQYCQGCHSQSSFPNFADVDLQTAYDAATSRTYVNLTNASRSRLYTKIDGIHQCSGDVCQTWKTDILTAITDWANGGSDTTTIANNIDDTNTDNADPTVNPSDNTGVDDGNIVVDSSNVEHQKAFELNLYPVLTNQCSGSGCHSDTQNPKFAQADIASAFTSVLSKVNLNNPANSRLVIKPLTPHNCTGDQCQMWSDNIKAGIVGWAAAVVGNIAGAGINNATVRSKALTWTDKVLVKSDGRIEDAIIAKFEFKTGSGMTAFDTSSVSPALDLTFIKGDGDIRWLKGGGIEISDLDNKENTSLDGSANASEKIYDMIAAPGASKEFTIEAWIINRDKALDGPARIVSYSLNSNRRNFTMGQVTDYYNFRNSTTLTGINGAKPDLETNNDNDDLKEQLQHVVFTFTETEGRKIFVNGIETSYEGVVADEVSINSPSRLFPKTDEVGGWSKNFPHLHNGVEEKTPFIFLLGNERNNNRQWQGKMLFVAVHNRALTKEEILRNTLEGIGEKFIFTFDISLLLDPSGATTSSIKVLVSELDEFSYVFGTPTLLTTIASPNIPVKNIRIAVNGNIPVAAQSFKNVDISAISAETVLSPLGAVIPKEDGTETDVFSLVFEQLGNNTNVVVEQPVIVLPIIPNNPPSPEIGLRTFEQVNNTMAVLTGVDKTSVAIQDSYLLLKEQLPGTPNVDAFVSSQQVGIAKLALDYCDALVEDDNLRPAFFGSFDFTVGAFTTFNDQAQRDIITSALVTKMIGSGLNDQPSLAEVKTELDTLFTGLLVNCPDDTVCGPIVTRSFVKAACASVMASAAVIVN